MSRIDLTRREFLAGAGALAVAPLLPQQRPPAAPANPRVVSSLQLKPPTLWVNGTTGSDSYTRAQVAAGGGSAAWRTITRAAKGCAPGGTPSASEAAQAGDVVDIAAGTYSTTGTNSRWTCAYNPVNEGRAGSPITFQAAGIVTLTFSSGIGPVIGADGRDHITWDGFFIDQANAPGASDTGPCVFHLSVGGVVRNCTLDGNGGTSPFDNHPGVRLNDAYRCDRREQHHPRLLQPGLQQQWMRYSSLLEREGDDSAEYDLQLLYRDLPETTGGVTRARREPWLAGSAFTRTTSTTARSRSAVITHPVRPVRRHCSTRICA